MTRTKMKLNPYRPVSAPSAGGLIPIGFAAGVINGLLGCGGGIITVLALTAFLPDTEDPRERTRNIFAATVIAVLPMSAASALVYGTFGAADIAGMLPLAIPSAAGGALGALLLDRINTGALKKIFALLMIYSGVRLIFGGS